MKANELRLGNFVSYNGFVCSVYSVSSPYPNESERYNDKETVDLLIDGIITVTIDEIEPITVTDEWLDGFGFKILLRDFAKLSIVGYDIFYTGGELTIYTSNDREIVLRKKVKHIHSLQNAIYIACGKEIAIK